MLKRILLKSDLFTCLLDVVYLNMALGEGDAAAVHSAADEAALYARVRFQRTGRDWALLRLKIVTLLNICLTVRCVLQLQWQHIS